MTTEYENFFNLIKEETDYSSIQDILNNSSDGSSVFHFEEFIQNVIHGELSMDLSGILELIKTVAFGQLKTGSGEFMKILAITLVAAIFSNFSFAFQGSHVADTAFYVTYLILYGILAVSYYAAYGIAYHTISNLTEFMKLLVPSYCMAIVLGTGTVTSVYWYEATLVLITITDTILLKIILPMINMYMIISLASNLSKENHLSRFVELLETIIRWGLKTMTAIVIGIGTIQSMLTPSIDRMKRIGIVKTASAIPGIGSMLSGVTETMLGAGALLRNAIGTAGMLSIVVICIIPIIKLSIYVLLFKAGAAVIQPVSEKRITDSMNSGSVASGMLAKTLLTGALLFLLAIALVAYTTL